MNPNFFLRLARIARRRPRAQQLWIILGILAVLGLVAALETLGWWPDWATSDPRRRIRP